MCNLCYNDLLISWEIEWEGKRMRAVAGNWRCLEMMDIIDFSRAFVYYRLDIDSNDSCFYK